MTNLVDTLKDVGYITRAAVPAAVRSGYHFSQCLFRAATPPESWTTPERENKMTHVNESIPYELADKGWNYGTMAGTAIGVALSGFVALNLILNPEFQPLGLYTFIGLNGADAVDGLVRSDRRKKITEWARV